MQTTSQEKDTMKDLLAVMTNLCQKIEKIEADVQDLKGKTNSQQHDYKHAESRPKSSRDWHSHLPSYVSEPINTKPNISNIITQYNAEDLNSLMKIN